VFTPEVAEAIEQIRASYASNQVDARSDGEGGAFVLVHEVVIGERWKPSTTWIGFRITFQYPNADVYPHYIRDDLHRADGSDAPPFMARTTWDGKSVLQVSRKSNHLNPALDTAVLKLHKVIDWLKHTA
jgi:hypothetical protein